ncbi:hypothetical protein [Streptomyces sp. NPDC048111]|uniref:hypothetical protein n=1 Tax=Streptomyces sp. NPDC048111 TaxID=3365500 RepID=UPI00371843A9
MSWESWTTTGIFAGPGGVPTGEGGPVLTGQLDVHTTWTEAEKLAYVTVQYSGASEWLPLEGSPAPCPSATASRDLHDAAVVAVRKGTALTPPGSLEAPARHLDSSDM